MSKHITNIQSLITISEALPIMSDALEFTANAISQAAGDYDDLLAEVVDLREKLADALDELTDCQMPEEHPSLRSQLHLNRLEAEPMKTKHQLEALSRLNIRRHRRLAEKFPLK